MKCSNTMDDNVELLLSEKNSFLCKYRKTASDAAMPDDDSEFQHAMAPEETAETPVGLQTLKEGYLGVSEKALRVSRTLDGGTATEPTPSSERLSWTASLSLLAFGADTSEAALRRRLVAALERISISFLTDPVNDQRNENEHQRTECTKRFDLHPGLLSS